jgi:hypothetical protein
MAGTKGDCITGFPKAAEMKTLAQEIARKLVLKSNDLQANQLAKAYCPAPVR